jgi:hypothetical protein
MTRYAIADARARNAERSGGKAKSSKEHFYFVSRQAALPTQGNRFVPGKATSGTRAMAQVRTALASFVVDFAFLRFPFV